MHSIPARRQHGLSLVELMIAITLGLIIMAGLTTIFIRNNQTRQETERTSQQIENGRYAMQLLSEDLKIAGYYAEYLPPTRLPAAFTALPDPCATDVATIANLGAPAFLLHVQGYDNGTGAPGCLGGDVKPNTDILVVRRVSSCVQNTANCDPATAGVPYFQASLCYPVAGGAGTPGTELSSANALCPLCGDYFALDAYPGASLTLHKTNCAAVADLRRYVTNIYFIANNDNAGDGIPTLKRAELGAGGFTIVPLVEGIENLQLEYGLDTAPATAVDGIPDVYTADPTSYGMATLPSSCSAISPVCNWWNVVAVNIHLLARSTTASPGYVDGKSYTLGDVNVGPFNDGFRRHAYETAVRLLNPSGRRQ